MDAQNDEFLKKLIMTFQSEAKEHIQTILAGLVELEHDPMHKPAILETIFRATHSLKGAARAVNLTDIESLCHTIENVFSDWLHKEDKLPTAAFFDKLHEILDAMGDFIQGMEQKSQKALPRAQYISDLQALQQEELPKHIKTIQAPAAPLSPVDLSQDSTDKTSPTVESATVFKEKPMLLDTIRISTAKLDPLLLQIEELLSLKLDSAQRAADTRQALLDLSELKKQYNHIQLAQKTLQRAVRSLDRTVAPALHKLLKFLHWESEFIQIFEAQLLHLSKSAEQGQHVLGSMVDSLLEDMKKALMQPISTAFSVFPKLVRDVSRSLGKEVMLHMSGTEIEIDRRILEEIYDPIIHILRNSVDHGIEAGAIRQEKHKPAQGGISIRVEESDSNHIKIDIVDDGAGINLKALRAKAQELGWVTQAQAHNLSQEELLPLIFRSGMSTSPIITDLSGRGLGLAIVWDKIEKLGGSIVVDSQPDKGTSFSILLPITLSTFRGVYVRVQDQWFVFPTIQVKQGLQLTQKDIRSVENQDTILWQGEVISLVHLAAVLGLDMAEFEDVEEFSVVILDTVNANIAFRVDEILSEEDILVKGLNKQLLHVRNISGASLLGSGKLIPILNISDLLRSALKVSTHPQLVHIAKSKIAPTKSILIVEDSIISRTLLKNILEAAGYQVMTATDGMEALKVLTTQSFDLILSDVDMPRMDGFELTEKIRTDITQHNAKKPIVLITALESKEDKERGIQVGANAYLVKSRFDQSNLLQTIQRLV